MARQPTTTISSNPLSPTPHMSMRLLYSSAISFYALGVRCAAPFNVKARQMRTGWKQWRDKFPKQILENNKVAWFHASSLGEFEQARPVMEAFHKSKPDYKIVLSFFSPSGYEVRKNYDGADIVCYLPPDTQRNARDFISMMHPDAAFFVKYDFWFNCLEQLRRRGTPTYLFSAIFRPGQYFFKRYGRWFARQLDIYRHIFVQDENSKMLLKGIGIDRCSIAGDTRFDRVCDIARQSKSFPAVERFANNATLPVIMAGSSWEPDEENLKYFIDHHPHSVKLILAPHMIGETHLQFIERLFSPEKCVRYSHIVLPDADETLMERPVLIIDNIGMLSSLYRYADIAYIGGGFGKGIHNTLEAAVFNIPVCFGPNYQKFQEARGLIACGGGCSYSEAKQLTDILSKWLDDKDAYNKASEACHIYMQNNTGATAAIMDKLI